MGLDMYAFSLERSPAFSTVHDVLNYRIPTEGKDLPGGLIMLGMDEEMFAEVIEVAGPEFAAVFGRPPSFSPSLDVGREFLDSKYVLPGSTLLQRWRKHHDLHEWMKQRWRSMPWHRGANGDLSVNTRVVLDVQDLDALERLVRTGQLPKVPGYSMDARVEDDLAFINAARKELAAGKFVYYTCWW